MQLLGTYNGKTVDICLPQGYALVFQQKNLFHAGMPVVGSGVKYIAQVRRVVCQLNCKKILLTLLLLITGWVAERRA